MGELHHESSQVNLLVSLLLRFPLLSTVHYYPNDRNLKMVIFLKELSEDSFNNLCIIIKEHLASHNRLLSKEGNCTAQLEMSNEEGLASIIIWHQLNPAFSQEATIIFELISEYLADDLIIESKQFLDELPINEADLEELFIKIHSDNNKIKLTGLRSDGKVLVYRDNLQNGSS